MSLKQWCANGWLRPHSTNMRELTNLYGLVERDFRDAEDNVMLSCDWRFGIAYNAALKLCTMLLYAQGYRPENALAHFRTINAMPLILGAEHKKDARYLDECRIKRNTAEYDFVGCVTADDVNELLCYVRELKAQVVEHFNLYHQEYIGAFEMQQGMEM